MCSAFYLLLGQTDNCLPLYVTDQKPRKSGFVFNIGESTEYLYTDGNDLVEVGELMI